jgi:hypothetical protein
MASSLTSAKHMASAECGSALRAFLCRHWRFWLNVGVRPVEMPITFCHPTKVRRLIMRHVSFQWSLTSAITSLPA